jgi:hypothetical protein
MEISPKYVRQVLHQAFPYGSASGVRDIFGEAWCLRDASLQDWQQLLQHLLKHELVEESGEPDYYRLTSKGEQVLNGHDYMEL